MHILKEDTLMLAYFQLKTTDIIEIWIDSQKTP